MLRAYDHPNEAFSRAIFKADDEAFQDHFGYVEGDLDKEYERYMYFFTQDESFDPDLWFIAMDRDEVAGISLCRKWAYGDKDMGWVSSLAVRRPWRKRGIGLALLHHSFGVFWERGYKKVGLGVDASNLTGALKLYKKAGMEIDRQFNLYEKELRHGEELQIEKLEV